MVWRTSGKETPLDHTVWTACRDVQYEHNAVSGGCDSKRNNNSRVTATSNSTGQTSFHNPYSNIAVITAEAIRQPEYEYGREWILL
jgi:hypothetical protein